GGRDAGAGRGGISDRRRVRLRRRLTGSSPLVTGSYPVARAQAVVDPPQAPPAPGEAGPQPPVDVVIGKPAAERQQRAERDRPQDGAGRADCDAGDIPRLRSTRRAGASIPGSGRLWTTSPAARWSRFIRGGSVWRGLRVRPGMSRRRHALGRLTRLVRPNGV